MIDKDLFGAPCNPLRAPTKAKGPQKRGHAAPPGTGPDGKTCGTCKHLTRLRFSKTYLKCELRRKSWTGGAGSDVRKKDAACRFFEKEET